MLISTYPKNRYSPVVLLFLVILAISFITRVVLMLSFPKSLDAGIPALAGAFALGFLYDLVTAGFIIIPFIFQVAFTNNFIYSSPGKWIAILLFSSLLFILLFTNIIPRDFNKDLHKGLTIYVALRFACYVLLLNCSAQFRLKWRSAVLQIFTFLVIFLLVFNAVSEWFFWNEFSSRYNFIAVDYLVYTNEVLGNIRESYPIGWLIFIVLVFAALIFLVLRKYIETSVRALMPLAQRLIFGGLFLLIPVAGFFIVNPEWENFSQNNYANELAGNGLYDFVQAFQKNELDFYKYYQTIPDREAFRIVREQLTSPNSSFIGNDSFSIDRTIHDSLPEKKMNVVLISVESLSASFMTSFGNTQGITPRMDSLAREGILFTNLYASGTRTVRGLEALALSIPPTAGQSLVKRPNNENLFSLGSVFKSKGYATQYIYGGYGYFDNMNYFFGHNNYEVLDRDALDPKEIHYANIWGVADEDLFTLALKTMDSSAAAAKPFFSHVMTVSNHRPYTYPAGRIDISPSTQTREGAVKYTDFAIGDFIKRASSRPWFNNTMFVIVADHCASSAGSEALPVPGYHIPMIIYAPGYLKPANVSALTAQIDIAPTILGLLHFSYESKFFGIDVLNSPVSRQRAFISTYQGLGYLKNGFLVVQSPVKKLKSYLPDPTTGKNAETTIPDSIKKEAVANYQVASWLIRNKRFGAYNHQ
jgi:phosphoglycerol transferase MdoB-like AlkP superfamily enzyme